MDIKSLLTVGGLVVAAIMIAQYTLYADAAMVILDQTQPRKDRLKAVMPHFVGMAAITVLTGAGAMAMKNQ